MLPAIYIPNLITIARILAVPFFIWLLVDQHFERALLVLLILGLSDALDGFLARCYGWKTTLGAYLDPIADKIMLLSIFLTFALMGWVPWWLTLLVVARDILLMLGAIYYHLVTRQLSMEPLSISKINTFMQITLAVSLVYNQVINVNDFFLNIMMTLVVSTTLMSGFEYVTRWYQRANKIQTNKVASRSSNTQ